MHTTCDFFQQRVNEAFSMYCDDEDTGKKVVFNKDHMEGMIWHSDADFPFIVLFFMWHIQGGIIVVSSNFFAVFEEAFSMFDVNASGKIQFKFFFPLLRSLGYNIHQAEAWDYLNELELAGEWRGTVTLSIILKKYGSALNYIRFFYYFKLITWRRYCSSAERD